LASIKIYSFFEVFIKEIPVAETEPLNPDRLLEMDQYI
jgi:hypothetical protein